MGVAVIIVIVSHLCWRYNKDRTIDEDRQEEESRSRRRNRQRRRQPRSVQHVSVKTAMKGEKSGPSYDELSPSTTTYSYIRGTPDRMMRWRDLYVVAARMELPV